LRFCPIDPILGRTTLRVSALISKHETINLEATPVSIDLSLKRMFRLLMVGLLLFVSGAGFAEAADGVVVNYFSSGAGAVVIDRVGRIVTAGSPGLPGFALTRHNSDGSLDTTFGNGGVTITDLSSNHHDGVSTRAMVMDSHGRFLVAGNSWAPANSKFLLARYNPDGSLDINFGNGGLVTGDISGEGGDSWIGGLATDILGRIVVAGYSDTGANGAKRSIALARYKSDGSLDPAFGNGGIVTTEIGSGGSGAGAVAMDSFGKIVVAGYSDDTVTSTFALARYNSDGSLDNTFGGGAGIVVVTDVGTIGGFAYANTVVIDNLGRIAVGGSATTVGRGQLTSFALVRCNSDGSLDTSFGNGGKLTTRISGPGLSYFDDSDAAAIIIDSLGRIVGVSVCPVDCGAFDFELARYNSDGSLDNTFGNGGLVTTHVGDASTGNSSTAIAIDSLGRIVAAGWVEDLVVGSVDDYHSVLARYNSDGTFDNTFGTAIGSVPMVTGMQFDPIRSPFFCLSILCVAAGSSYSVDFSGPNLTDETFFDVRYTAPGRNDSAVVTNWQKGLGANHSVPADTASGTWTINGVRAHQVETDHSGNFVAVWATITVSP
jgi:uncharacterized delta-60 repeat protein